MHQPDIGFLDQEGDDSNTKPCICATTRVFTHKGRFFHKETGKQKKEAN